MTEFAVELQRTFPVPRAKVYRAWLDPRLLARWYSPDDMAITHTEVDERVGGRHLCEMLHPDGSRHAFESVIEELVADERIVLQFTFVGAAPVAMREDTLLTLTFADGAAPGTTDFTLRQERITLSDALNPDNVDIGWGMALAKLAALYERSQ